MEVFYFLIFTTFFLDATRVKQDGNNRHNRHNRQPRSNFVYCVDTIDTIDTMDMLTTDS